MKTTINQILFTQNTKHDILANAIIPDFKHQIQFTILNQDRKTLELKNSTSKSHDYISKGQAKD